MLRAGALALEERLREQGSAHTRAGLWGAERSPQHPPWVIRVDGAPSNHVWPRNQPCSEQAAGQAPHQIMGLPDGHSEQCFEGCIPSTPCICPWPPRSFPALHTTQACTLALCCLESFLQNSGAT